MRMRTRCGCKHITCDTDYMVDASRKEELRREGQQHAHVASYPLTLLGWTHQGVAISSHSLPWSASPPDASLRVRFLLGGADLLPSTPPPYLHPPPSSRKRRRQIPAGDPAAGRAAVVLTLLQPEVLDGANDAQQKIHFFPPLPRLHLFFLPRSSDLTLSTEEPVVAPLPQEN